MRVEDFASLWGLSKPQAYDAVRKLPPGVKVCLGKRIRINADRFQAWMAAGGTLSEA